MDSNSLEHLLNRRRIACEGHCHLKAFGWNVAHRCLDVVGNPFHKVGRILVLDIQHLFIHLLGGHTASEESRRCQVSAMTWISGTHHVLRVEHPAEIVLWLSERQHGTLTPYTLLKVPSHFRCTVFFATGLKTARVGAHVSVTFVFKMLRNGLLRYILYTCPNLWLRSCSKCYGMDCFGTYFTHVQTCDYVRVQSATEWTASVHTLHMSRPVITIVFNMLRNGLLRYILYTCPNLWLRSCSKCYGMDCFGTYFTHVQTCDYVRVQSATEWTASVHTLHMSKPVITFVFKMLRSGLLRFMLVQSATDLWMCSCFVPLISHPKVIRPSVKASAFAHPQLAMAFHHSDLFSLCGTQVAKMWQTNQRVKFQRPCRNKQIQSKKGPIGGYMFFCKSACRWPKNTRNSKPPAGWRNLQNQYLQYMWKNTESLGMPRIENEHTAAFHFRPGGYFLFWVGKKILDDTGTPSLPSLSQMTKKCVSALHKSRLLAHAT